MPSEKSAITVESIFVKFNSILEISIYGAFVFTISYFGSYTVKPLTVPNHIFPSVSLQQAFVLHSCPIKPSFSSICVILISPVLLKSSIFILSKPLGVPTNRLSLLSKIIKYILLEVNPLSVFILSNLTSLYL